MRDQRPVVAARTLEEVADVSKQAGAEIRGLTLNAVENCWLPDQRKAAFRARIVAAPGWLP